MVRVWSQGNDGMRLLNLEGDLSDNAGLVRRSVEGQRNRLLNGDERPGSNRNADGLGVGVSVPDPHGVIHRSGSNLPCGNLEKERCAAAIGGSALDRVGHDHGLVGNDVGDAFHVGRLDRPRHASSAREIRSIERRGHPEVRGLLSLTASTGGQNERQEQDELFHGPHYMTGMA